MKCKFSRINFGDKVYLHSGTSACGVCGSDVQPQVEQILWKYVGHSNDVDLFEPLTVAACPSCGKRITGYAERCGELGGLNVTEEILANRYSEIHLTSPNGT